MFEVVFKLDSCMFLSLSGKSRREQVRKALLLESKENGRPKASMDLKVTRR